MDNRDRLLQSAAIGRISHAYLISGQEGAGKRDFARDFARTALCSGAGDKPCGQCKSCRKFANQTHPDIKEYSGDGGKNSFHIETVRGIRTDLYVTPTESDYKFYLLFNVENMNIHAHNAFLKILEEPPRYAVFLLTCDNPKAIPSTILSRTMNIPLNKIHDEPDESYAIAEEIAVCMIKGQEYRSASLLGALEGDRKQAIKIMVRLGEILAEKLKKNAIEKSGKKINSQNHLTGRKINSIIILLEDIISALEGNANVALTLSYLNIYAHNQQEVPGHSR
ncbi:MAG: hypothetical protein FWH14_06120 [Oscillospiraceae bacterium]|nr:hypothetical protein [Oscillospiraceae bacterium]